MLKLRLLAVAVAGMMFAGVTTTGYPSNGAGSGANFEPQREFTETEVYVIQEEMKTAPERDLELLGNFELTAYCPCQNCSEGWEKQTATQTVCTEGRTVAVDPEVIPLGSELVINGKHYKAEDVGGLVKGRIIDIYLESHSDVEEFGRQYGEVWLKK